MKWPLLEEKSRLNTSPPSTPYVFTCLPFTNKLGVISIQKGESINLFGLCMIRLKQGTTWARCSGHHFAREERMCLGIADAQVDVLKRLKSL